MKKNIVKIQNSNGWTKRQATIWEKTDTTLELQSIQVRIRNSKKSISKKTHKSTNGQRTRHVFQRRENKTGLETYKKVVTLRQWLGNRKFTRQWDTVTPTRPGKTSKRTIPSPGQAVKHHPVAGGDLLQLFWKQVLENSYNPRPLTAPSREQLELPDTWVRRRTHGHGSTACHVTKSCKPCEHPSTRTWVSGGMFRGRVSHSYENGLRPAKPQNTKPTHKNQLPFCTLTMNNPKSKIKGLSVEPA